jgi:diguanylate cyclase (GGDEF)-like protein
LGADRVRHSALTTETVIDPDADGVLRACRAARKAYGASRVWVWLYDAAADGMAPYIAEPHARVRSASGSNRWSFVPLGDFPLAATVLARRTPVVVDAARTDPRLPRGLATDLGIDSLRALPLHTGRPVGMLAVEPGRIADPTNGSRVVELVAASAGQALAWKEADRLKAEAQFLLDLGDAVVAEPSLRRAIHAAGERLDRRIGVERSFLFLREKGRMAPRVALDSAGTDLSGTLPQMAPDLPLVEATAGSGLPSHAPSGGSPLINPAWAEALGPGHVIAVPLGRSPDVRGVWVLCVGEDRRVTPAQIRLAGATGSHLALAVDRARVDEEKGFRTRAADEVKRLFEEGSTAISIEEAAEALARVTRDATRSQSAVVYLVDIEGRIAQVAGAGTLPNGQRLKDVLVGTRAEDFPPWRLAAEGGEAVFVDDASSSGLLPRDVIDQFELGAYAALPLLGAEGQIGLVMCSRSTGSRWTGEEKLLAIHLAYQGAMIVENTQLRTADQERLHELSYQSFHDPLTKLANRSLFDDRVEHALARADRRHEAVAVMFVDIDNFKEINDLLGHEGGDALLVAVSERLRDCLRPEDTIARLGGDEFTILIEDIGRSETVQMIADRVSMKLRQPFSIRGEIVTLTLSIGISVSWPGCMEAGALVRNADLAMYRAKLNGRARAEVFDYKRDALGQVELEAESALRRAVEANEFVLHYQPKVDLRSGRIVGMEALVRWDDPTRGMVPPFEFIPLAESTGLIVPIGRWVLETVCFQLRRWYEWYGEDRVPPLWVNLSAMEFQRGTLIEEVCDLIGRSGIAPGLLGLEITETTMMDDAEATAETLARLREVGVRLALDDFGSGYSSLNYLKRFPVNVLKIDRSFVQGLPNAEDEAIVKAVATLARTLGQKVVAEGVETVEHLLLLRDLGAEIGQGYYFSKPVPVKAAELLVTDTPIWLPDDVGARRAG